MDVSRAQLSNTRGGVSFDDPAFPFTVHVALNDLAERPEVENLTVTARASEPVTREVLSRIPVRQLAAIAASELRGGGDEARYRMLVVERPEGMRSWPPEHYQRVLRVAQWARRSGRDGGEIATIAEFWGVCPRTARRWLEVAREGRK